MRARWPSLFALLLPLSLLLLYPFPYGWDFDLCFNALKTLQGQGLREVWRGVGTGDAHPPGYYLLYKAWMGVRGYDPLPPGVPEEAVDWALLLNLGGAVFMAGAVSFVGWYLLGAWGGVLALGILLFYGDMAHAPLLRMYPFAGGLAVLSAWAYLTRRPLMGSLLGVVGLYTHYLVGVAVAPFALLALWEGWRLRGVGSLLAYLPYLLFLPWVPMVAYQLQHGHHFPHIRPYPEHLFLYVGQKWPGVFLYLFLPLALYASWKHVEARRLSLASAAGLYLWFYLSLVVNAVLVRYVFLFSGLIALALGAGIKGLPSWARGVTALTVVGLGGLNLYYQREVSPWEDITGQARLARIFLEKSGSMVLYLDGRGRLQPFRLHLPQLEDRVQALGWREATELCETEAPFLLWRYHHLRAEESPVQHVLDCLRGRVRLLHPTPRGSLYLYWPTRGLPALGGPGHFSKKRAELPESATGTPSPDR